MCPLQQLSKKGGSTPQTPSAGGVTCHPMSGNIVQASHFRNRCLAHSCMLPLVNTTGGPKKAAFCVKIINTWALGVKIINKTLKKGWGTIQTRPGTPSTSYPDLRSHTTPWGAHGIDKQTIFPNPPLTRTCNQKIRHNWGGGLLQSKIKHS